MSPITTDNPRQADYPINPLFIERWSPRSYLDKAISDETLYTILEAARWAPSASNEQPWRFIVARTQEEKERFYPFIAEGNLLWCKKAPVLMMLLSHKVTSRETENRSHSFDAGTAWGYLALEAARQGLSAHAMAGFDPEKARAALHVPDEYDLQVVISLGYRGDRSALSEPLQARETPSLRRPLSASIFTGIFGK